MTGLNRAPLLLSACVLTAALTGVPSLSTLSAQVPGSTPALGAQADSPHDAFSQPSAASEELPYSSSSTASDAPSALSPAPPVLAMQAAIPTQPRLNRGTKPFSAFAVAIKGGIAGIGFDVATPLAQRWNLRGGASFFSYSSSYLADGTTINGDLKLRSVNLSADWFPFNNRFRVSPGVILYNGNGLNAAASVAGGQSFDLGNATYTSSTTDPIHGSAVLKFGNRTAPSLTVGAGNMIPRHGDGHFSIPFEVGFQYISAPTLTLNLQGTACSGGVCQNTQTNPQFQANLQQENSDLNSDISNLRFYPIVSIGVGYKF